MTRRPSPSPLAELRAAEVRTHGDGPPRSPASPLAEPPRRRVPPLGPPFTATVVTGTHRERGGATVCLLAVGLVLLLSGIFGAAVAAARLGRQRAGVAADFGALAAASRVPAGEQVACATAAELVRANAARLVGCRLDGLDVLVTVEVTVSPVPGLTRIASATSRAGPVRA